MASDTPLTLRGKLVWIGLIAFVATWMFVLGIMVGRGTVPITLVNQTIDDGLAELKKAMVKPSQNHPDDSTATEESILITDLNFYEDLKKATGARKALPPQAPKPAAPSLPATKPPAVAAKEAPKPAKDIPVPAIKSADQQAVPTADKAKTRFTIQVAAVKDAGNADKLVDELRSKGFDAYQIQNRSQDGNIWYRIRVGAFEDRTAAEAALVGLKKRNFTGLVLSTP